MRKIEGIIPTTLEQAYALLGGRATATLAKNTSLVLFSDTGSVGLKLHDTVIVEYTRRGEYVLKSGGYRTVTTKARMNAALHGSGFKIDAVKGEWIISTGRPSRPAFRFFEGVTLKRAGGVSGECSLGRCEVAK